MNKKGETFGCLVGMLGAAIFIVGVFICMLSRFLCVELDFTEEQRNACETKANFVLVSGFLLTIGSIGVMLFSSNILGLFDKHSGKNEQN